LDPEVEGVSEDKGNSGMADTVEWEAGEVAVVPGAAVAEAAQEAAGLLEVGEK